MVRKKKIIIDEHEMIEETPIKKTHFKFAISYVFAMFLLIVMSYMSFNYLKSQRERKRIDEIVVSIQNEIYLKQCMLDKLYCCEYKDVDACDKWVANNCLEEDGSPEMNCKISLK